MCKVFKKISMNMTFINKLLFVVILTVGLFTAGSGIAHAQTEGSVLFISPHRVDIAPDGRIQELNVANKSDVPRRYDLQIINQVMTENGVTERRDSFEYSAEKMLKFTPKRFTLEPGERQVIRVMVRRPKDLADGDYHSHLLFREVPLRNQERNSSGNGGQQKASFEIQALYGVAVPVVVQHGTVNSSMGIVSATLAQNEQDQSGLAIEFSRSGNGEASAYLSVVHRLPGQEDVSVTTEQWVRIYREVDKIRKFVALKPPADHHMSGGTLVLTLTKDPRSPEAQVIATTEVSLP
ncbi:MAG: molecular chaperone [Alphaproteobacteria bacterium]|nr:MAG: molecular chaperone [Alphaproteobacteria bacterium]